MSDGMFYAENGVMRRFKSKKELREKIVADPENVIVEHTSIMHQGPPHTRITDLAPHTKVDFVGPDPHRDRRFYGRLSVTSAGVVKMM